MYINNMARLIQKILFFLVSPCPSLLTITHFYLQTYIHSPQKVTCFFVVFFLGGRGASAPKSKAPHRTNLKLIPNGLGGYVPLKLEGLHHLCKNKKIYFIKEQPKASIIQFCVKQPGSKTKRSLFLKHPPPLPLTQWSGITLMV